MLLGQPLTVEVTLGWTRSDMANGYSSFDGYKPGASQHTETFEIQIPVGTTIEDIANAAFEATNAPVTEPGSLAEQIYQKIQQAGYRGEGAHYSFSTGDTVTVGEGTLACARFGWKRVSLAPPAEVS